MEYSARLSRSRLSTWSQSSHQILWMAVQSLQIFRHRSSDNPTQFSGLLRINHCFEFEQFRRPPPSHKVITESFLKWKPVQFCHLWRGLNKHPLFYFLFVAFPSVLFRQLLWQIHIWVKLWPCVPHCAPLFNVPGQCVFAVPHLYAPDRVRPRRSFKSWIRFRPLVVAVLGGLVLGGLEEGKSHL